MTRKPRLGPSALAFGIRYGSLTYLGLVLVFPLLGLVFDTLRTGPAAFFEALFSPAAQSSLTLSFAAALIMVGVNAVMGTATAWVLVRYRLPAKSLLNALIDLPFAVPTLVTGIMLVILFGPSGAVGKALAGRGMEVIYHKPGIVLALLYVTYPFVVRSVQPVLLELDRAEEEAAATLGAGPATTFFRVTLPALWPAILSGSALAFSRALGEYGAVVMVAGNHPGETQTAPLFIMGAIESGEVAQAKAVSTFLLACSLGALLLFKWFERKTEAQDER